MIELSTAGGAIFNALTAAAMLAFGLWVVTLTPRTRASKLLAVFALATGLLFVPHSLFEFSGWVRLALWEPYQGVAWGLGGLALLGLARVLLEPWDERARRLWYLALAVAVLVPLAAVVTVPYEPALRDLETWQLLSIVFEELANFLYYSAFLGLGLVLVRRYRHPPGNRAEGARMQAALMSAALVLWPAMGAGWWVAIGLADPTRSFLPITVGAVALFIGFLLLAGLWLVNAAGVPHRSAEARNIALLTLGMLLVGLVQGVFIDPLLPRTTDSPLWGAARLGTVLVLGYAVLRHEILGVEAKFRWGVSKTTVAGVFVTVFFVVSEGAQVLFADFAGNEFIGVAAAALLVFAISPLQRFADRFAAKAVPGGAEAGAGAEARFRSHVETALADGEITRDEERHLREKADELGLTSSRAFAIREQVEDGADDGGDEP